MLSTLAMRARACVLALSLVACGGGPGSPAAPGRSDAGDDGAAATDDGGNGATADGGGPGEDAGDGASSDRQAPPGADGATDAEGEAGAGDPNLHVVGNELVVQGKATRLLGVDHSGTEYACIQSGGYGFTEGPDPDTLAKAMLTWGHVNAVRVPLNEDCWLGINGANPMYSGQAYQSAMLDYTSKLHAHGLYTIVDLHWNAPGTFPATAQQPMADADHGPAFWKSVAAAFASDRMTVFDLYNEPYVDTTNAQTADPWACWKSGCTITQSAGGVTGNWQSAGMQDLVAAVRSTGAKNVLMLGGLAWSNDLSGWLAHAPTDPLGQMTASFHNYNFNACSSSTCWDSVIASVAAQVPVVTGEMGENDCAHGYIDAYMPWADAHHVSYLGWTWNVWDCASGPALITDYDGGATGFGAGLEAHLLVTSP